MLTIDKYFLVGLIAVGGEILISNPTQAQTIHDTTLVNTTHSLVDTSVPSGSFTGSLDSDTGVFTVEGLGGDISISPDVIQSIQDISGTSGSTGSGTVGRRNTISGDTISGDADTISSDSSNSVTICLADPCVPAGESTRAITLNELAKLMQDDLQQSLKDLAAAEAIEKKVEGQPRTFVRRRSTHCTSPTIEARETVKTKLEESQKFIEQMELVNPDKNIW